MNWIKKIKAKEYILNFLSFPSVISSWISKFVSLLAFCQPSPSYSVGMIERQDINSSKSEELVIDLNRMAKKLLDPYKYYKDRAILERYQREGSITSFFTTSSRGNRLFSLKMSSIIRSDNSGNKRYTIVYSHPNGCDLGLIIGFLWRLSRKCKCDVVAYDYSGYGMSSGKASERNIYSDIESVFRTLIGKYKIQENMIILYGESIGSAPTIDLAAKNHCFPGGIVLHCPILSGLRTFYNYNRPSWTFDPFPNIDKITDIKAPVIHGMRDSVVNISHGILIYQKCRYKVSPLWLRDANHNDIRIFPPFFKRISHFLEECNRFQSVRHSLK